MPNVYAAVYSAILPRVSQSNPGNRETGRSRQIRNMTVIKTHADSNST